MRIAWVTHRPWGDAGGAEAADQSMVVRRPEAVDEVLLVRPGGVDTDLAAYDRVIVTGMYGFSDRELNTLADLKPVLWVHDAQFPGHFLIEAARAVMLLTPQHREFERKASPLLRSENIYLNPSWFDTRHISPCKSKKNAALWAHRPEAHKGLDRAAEWCRENKVPIEVLVNVPHNVVLLKMCATRYFLLLSHIFDPGPRAVMEAKLSGCELVVDNVGYWSDPDDLRARIDRADKDFWDVVMGV